MMTPNIGANPLAFSPASHARLRPAGQVAHPLALPRSALAGLGSRALGQPRHLGKRGIMRHSRALSQAGVACAAAVLAASALAGPAGAGTSTNSTTSSGASAEGPGVDTYLVLTRTAGDASAVTTKLRSNGASVTSVNKDIGVVGVRS